MLKPQLSFWRNRPTVCQRDIREIGRETLEDVARGYALWPLLPWGYWSPSPGMARAGKTSCVKAGKTGEIGSKQWEKWSWFLVSCFFPGIVVNVGNNGGFGLRKSRFSKTLGKKLTNVERRWKKMNIWRFSSRMLIHPDSDAVSEFLLNVKNRCGWNRLPSGNLT